jgi:HPt (histidine-containing phosphotransfer) domain-containing protein
MGTINLSYLESISEGDANLIKELIEIFKEQVPSYLEEFDLAFEKKDAEVLSKIAHKAKSTVHIMGLIELAEALNKFELEALEGEFKENYQEYIKLFKSDCEEGIKQLEERYSD